MNGIFYIAILAFVVVCAVMAAPLANSDAMLKRRGRKYSSLVKNLGKCLPNDLATIPSLSVTDPKVIGCDKSKKFEKYLKMCPEVKKISEFKACFEKTMIPSKKHAAAAAKAQQQAFSVVPATATATAPVQPLPATGTQSTAVAAPTGLNKA